jgi:hypothetical protein
VLLLSGFIFWAIDRTSTNEWVVLAGLKIALTTQLRVFGRVPTSAVLLASVQTAFLILFLSVFMTAALLAASVPSGPILSSEWLLNSAEVVFDATRPFGSGAFAQVFRGRYRGQDVAVKVIHQNLLDNEERCVAFGMTTAEAGTRKRRDGRRRERERGGGG